MEIALFIILIPFLVLATIFSKGKGAVLIAGYNTMSDSEKSQYDEVALCKFTGKIMYGVSFCILLLAIAELLNLHLLMIIAVILLIIIITVALIYTKTGNRFKTK
ncbi:DUF3784 domain-containing protein [Metabacillus malikii]|uniref:DUF3784 domain-containing protein n=1 Tax=Metabacillus malikii TaxID=1504265 RepID=A0ABT9ZK58_9BACI|nr:DUF3784 domain-containing protein [Metabacillus malikii]MDQ0232652.1 hypothetical protein [Metabacillus malikii]